MMEGFIRGVVLWEERAGVEQRPPLQSSLSRALKVTWAEKSLRKWARLALVRSVSILVLLEICGHICLSL